MSDSDTRPASAEPDPDARPVAHDLGVIAWGAVVLAKRTDGAWPDLTIVAVWEPDDDYDTLPWRVNVSPGDYDYVGPGDLLVTHVLFGGVHQWPA